MIMKIIDRLKPKRSAGPDGIPTFLIKHIFRAIPSIITHSIDLSLAEGILPNRLKESIIKPMYKSGPKKKITKIRPISISKIYEIINSKHIFTTTS